LVTARRVQVLTMRGRTGAVVGMVPVAQESAPAVAQAIRENLSAEARGQVRFVFTDDPSALLHQELKVA
jgi:hypothetical protein